MAKIRLIESGEQLGVQVLNDTIKYYNREDLSVESNEINIIISNLGETVVEEPFFDFIDPKGSSPREVSDAVKSLITTIPVLELTLDEYEAINNADSPDGINTFVTQNEIDGIVRFKGDWDANTNTPTLTSGVGTKGDTYRVSVAGSTNLDGITDWQLNDRAYFDGTAWRKSDNTDVVTSVHGRTGDVVSQASDYDADQIDFTPDGDISATNVQDAITEVRDDTDTKLSAKEDTANKGSANGYAPLNGSSQIDFAYLPPGIQAGLTWKGTWDANTNTPSLSSGVGTNGDTYRVSVAGSTNLDGITDWQVGDWAMYNGTAWEKVDNTDQVTSVHGRTGAVVSAASDYDASQVDNDSGVSGAFVSDALDTLDGDLDTLKNSFYIEKITPGAPVTTGGAATEFFSNATGGVVPRSIDPAAGTYRVKVSFIVTNSSTFGRAVVDLQIGGTSIFSVPYAKEPKDVNDRIWVTMERRVALSAGAQNVDLNLSQVGAGTAALYEANVEIEEILT